MAVVPSAKGDARVTTKVFAHRGASGYAPENTLAAFRLAIEQGADGVELDVHRTQDGVLVVCHDQTIDRTTDSCGAIADMTFADLQSCSAGSWFGGAFADERIPTLKDVLSLYPDGYYVNIEIKNAPFQYTGIERQLADELHHYARQLNVVVSSFHHPTLIEFSRHAPDIPTGLLYEGGFIRIWDYVKSAGLPVKYLHPNADFVTREYVDEAHKRGYGVFAYSVDTEETLRRMIRARVDGIFTNYPDTAKMMVRSDSQS